MHATVNRKGINWQYACYSCGYCTVAMSTLHFDPQDYPKVDPFVSKASYYQFCYNFSVYISFRAFLSF